MVSSINLHAQDITVYYFAKSAEAAPRQKPAVSQIDCLVANYMIRDA